MMKKDNIFPTNISGDLKIIEYINSRKVRVKFVATGYETIAQSGNIRDGRVKDYYNPLVQGVGYLGKGKYKASNKGCHTTAYDTWCGMFRRCYNKSYLDKHPTYKGCTVSSEWHNFQTFAAWFEDKYIEGYELDKDTLVEGNKIYSPNTCVFISQVSNIQASKRTLGNVYFLKSPEKETYEFTNIAQFSREQNLDPSSISKLLRGKYKTVKGWRL